MMRRRRTPGPSNNEPSLSSMPGQATFHYVYRLVSVNDPERHYVRGRKGVPNGQECPFPRTPDSALARGIRGAYGSTQ